MFRGMMFLSVLTCLTLAEDAQGQDSAFGYLKVESIRGKEKSSKIEAYTPREGDLIFYDDRNPFWMALFAYAGTGSPLHMGMVVKKENGTYAVLEAGPDDTIKVALLDLGTRLAQFDRDFDGGITLRRCKKELTREQSAALTRFARAQDGKRYAIGRLLLQGTWLRSRGPVRELILGRTYLDRDSWICSELSVAGACVAKLLDAKTIHANATYPRDLVDNERHDLGDRWHDAAAWLPRRP